MKSLLRHKWIRLAGWAVLTVLALYLLAWLALPPLLKSQAQRIGSEHLGRKLSIGAVALNPFTLELTIGDVAVATADGTGEQAHVKRLYVNAAVESMWRLAPVIDDIVVDGVAAKVTHLGDGRYDIDDVLQKLSKPAEGSPSSSTPRFSLYNLSLANASVDYVDRSIGRTQELRDLSLGVPFISSFDSQREVKVAPRLAFTLNGTRFDSGALATPFAADRRADATITLKGLDLAPYLGYLPAGLPVKLQGAKIDADLKIGFEQTPKVAVKLSGTVGVHDLKVADAAGGDLLWLDALNVELVDVQPLAKIARLGAVAVVSPRVSLKRDASGRLNVAPTSDGSTRSSAPATARTDEPASTSAAAAATSPTPAPAPASAPASASASASAPAAPIARPAQPWTVELATLTLNGGSVDWKDDTVAGDTVKLNNVTLEASSIALPFEKAFPFKGSAALQAPPGGRLDFDGFATDKAASVGLRADGLPLELAAPYLAAVLQPDLAGRLAADLTIDWAASGSLTVAAKTLALTDLALTSTTGTDDADIDEAALVATSALDRKAGTDTTMVASGVVGRGAMAGRAAGSVVMAGRAAGSGATAGRATTGPATGRTAAGRRTTTTSAASTAPATDNRLPRNALATLGRLQLADARLDLAARTVAIGRIAVDAPSARVVRGADKRWMFERWLKSSADDPARTASVAPAPARSASAVAVNGRPWTYTVGEVAVTGGAMTFADLANVRPVRFDVSALAVELRNLSPDGGKPQPVILSARIGARRSDPGTLAFKGSLATAPLNVQGQLDAKRLPLHAFEPYFAAGLNVLLARADSSFGGQVAYAAGSAGPTLAVTGNVQVENFLVNSNPASSSDSSRTGTTARAGATAASASASANGGSVTSVGRSAAAAPSSTRAASASAPAPLSAPAGIRGALLAAGAEAARDDRRRPTGSLASTLAGDAGTAGEELLSWKTLNLRGVAVAMKPSAPLTVDVKETAATDLFARLIVKEDGRINLQDLVKSGTDKEAADRKASPPATSTPAPVIRFGPIGLANARVQFSDRFVKPNYSASLTELNGTLSSFSSVAPAGAPVLADLELRGRAEGSASLEITGKLNPLAKPLALDINGRVRDLELPPLSPYSVKYAGYGIQRGKMSVDVNYVVQPNGQLTATNKVVLNQLTFGDKVEGAPNSLPVKLAVALLADRNGVIDLNLPISGSLNDPQFSLFPVIMKVVGNVVMKAITSPFSLLSSAFGGGGGGGGGGAAGGDGLDAVAFAPGSTALSEPAREVLDKVSKALADRPALKMTVTGTSSVQAEREAYRRQRLMELVQAEKRRLSAGAGAGAGASPASPSASAGSPAAPTIVTVGPSEYPELLKAAYRSADIVKPRNLIGMAKDLPQDEVESLLLANIAVTDESIRELAVSRGVAVRDYLATKGVSLDRLFLGAAKTTTEASTTFEPEAQLALAAR